jgi:tRNA threonylcarbamoyladenosine biosynthesis protein TsaE
MKTGAPSPVLLLPDAAHTVALGAAIGAYFKVGDLICLGGPLGAGKTTLARGVIAAWTGREEDVPSPTFSLVQTYEGERGQLWHCDLYRLDGPGETLELGLDDAWTQAATLIEWPDRLGPFLPGRRLDVILAPLSGGRSVTFSAHGGHPGPQEWGLT